MAKPDSLFVTIRDICSPLVWSELFANSGPLHIDLGAGDGGFALALATKSPDINVLAVERLLGRARKIDRRARRTGLNNLRVLRLESAYLMQWLVPTASVQVIHIMHPDPWPKMKQRKHRLFQPAFIEACASALVTGGELRLTLDHPGYYGEIMQRMKGNEKLKPCFWRPGPDYPRSDFETQFTAEGKCVFRQMWIKQG